MLEKILERKVCQYAKDHGWLVYKWVSPNQRGVPDRILFKAGVTLCIEFKQLNKKPTALQKHHHKLLTAAGIEVKVIDSVDSGKQLIDHHNRRMR